MNQDPCLLCLSGQEHGANRRWLMHDLPLLVFVDRMKLRVSDTLTHITLAPVSAMRFGEMMKDIAGLVLLGVRAEKESNDDG